MALKQTVALSLAAALVFAAVASFLWTRADQDHTADADHSAHVPSPAVAHPEISGFRAVSREQLDTPLAAHDFHLVDQTGAEVTLHGLRGKAVLLSFIYTNCPEACPLTTAYYLELQRQFAAELDQGKLSLVLITTDPDHDTPRRLKEYTDARGGRWLFLSGDAPSLQATWDGYGIFREARAGLKEVVIYHSYKTALIDRQGMVRYVYQGVWSSQDVSRDIRSTLVG